MGKILNLYWQNPPIKMQIDPSKPLPGINQHPINKEALQGTKPIIDDYKSQGLIIWCTTPCNIPILPEKKPNDQGWRFVQDHQAINYTVIPCHPIVPNSHTFLASCPPKANFSLRVIYVAPSLASLQIMLINTYLPLFGEDNNIPGQ